MTPGLPAVPQEVAHAPLVALVGFDSALTVQVQGVLVEPAIVHDPEGQVHLRQEWSEG